MSDKKSVDLSKYKFIPPSKVLKTQKQFEDPVHFQSLTLNHE